MLTARTFHAHHHGRAGAAAEPLHLHFDIAVGDALLGDSLGQVGMLARIVVAFCRPGRSACELMFSKYLSEYHCDAYVRRRAECIVGQAFAIEE
jgi:hypothetical protein